jgi:hypothetical protein
VVFAFEYAQEEKRSTLRAMILSSTLASVVFNLLHDSYRGLALTDKIILMPEEVPWNGFHTLEHELIVDLCFYGFGPSNYSKSAESAFHFKNAALENAARSPTLCKFNVRARNRA